jgi:PAS domain S-box-containing protein
MFDSDTFASKKPDNRTSDQPVDIFVQSDPNQMDNSNLLSKTIENGLDIYSGFFDALFDSPHLGYLILDTNGFILATNKKFEEMVKTEGKEIISKSFSEFISTKNDLFTQSQLINFYDSPKDKHLDLWINRKEDKPLLTRINGFLSNSTRLTGQCSASRLLVVVADIKTTIPAKENLNYIESRYKVIADSSPIAISIIQNGKIVFANAALEKMLNYLSDQLIGIEVLSVIASEFHEMLKERINKISTPNENSSALSHLPVEIKMIKRDKTFSLVEAFFSSTLFDENQAILMQFIEISERKKSLDIYYRSQKLESLGLLASGIAHDFNNLLGGIFGFIDISRNFAESNDSASVIIHLSKALQVYDKAKKLTQQLLTFSKGGAPQKKYLPSMIQLTIRFSSPYAAQILNTVFIYRQIFILAISTPIR